MISSEKNLGLLVVLALCVLALSGCRRTPDEEQVREAIAAVAQAAEAGSASDVGTPLSEDFDGNAGELDRRGLTGMVQTACVARRACRRDDGAGLDRASR